MRMRTKSMFSACALGVALLSSATALAVAKGLFITYWSTGSATYADGSPVIDGERFVLVWSAPEKTIDLTKDITGDVNSFVGDDWGWISMVGSSGGHCERVNFSSANTLYSRGGRAQLYLLDTRISPTQLAPLGLNKNGDEFPTVVNAVVPIDGATYTWTKFDAPYHNVSGPAPATTAWTILPKKTPPPVIVSMICTNGVATVGVTNTVSTATYDLKGSLDLTFTNVVWSCASKAGLSDPNAALSFDDANATNSAAFYRIEVKK